MDLSGLIFVVLALAWAGYLIPRALRQDDALEAHRPIDEFSDTIRVLDRRQSGTPSPASRSSVDRSAEVSSAQAAPVAAAATPARPATRTAARRAARRRRRVLYVLLSLVAVVSGLAAAGTISWWWTIAPSFLVAAWLIASATLGRRERTVSRPVAPSAPVVVEQAPASSSVADAPVATEVDEVAAEDDGALWDPLPLTLPTYVTKPAARRTVRTIDLTRPAASQEAAPAVSEEQAPAAEAPAEQSAEAVAEQARRAV
ncbi:hypothetical protein GCM10027425_14360 [Alteromonas gracilis]